jgi:hypothetical protein
MGIVDLFQLLLGLSLHPRIALEAIGMPDLREVSPGSPDLFGGGPRF